MSLITETNPDNAELLSENVTFAVARVDILASDKVKFVVEIEPLEYLDFDDALRSAMQKNNSTMRGIVGQRTIYAPIKSETDQNGTMFALLLAGIAFRKK